MKLVNTQPETVRAVEPWPQSCLLRKVLQGAVSSRRWARLTCLEVGEEDCEGEAGGPVRDRAAGGWPSRRSVTGTILPTLYAFI